MRRGSCTRWAMVMVAVGFTACVGRPLTGQRVDAGNPQQHGGLDGSASAGPDAATGLDGGLRDATMPDARASADATTSQPDAGIATEGCFVVDAEQLAPTTGRSDLVIGGFRLSIGPNAGLRVAHVDEPSRVLFASPSSGDPFGAEYADVHAEELQGSFNVVFDATRTCRRPVLAEVRAGQGNVVLQGGFSEGGTECASAAWRLQFCESHPHHLGFRLQVEGAVNVATLRASLEADEVTWGMGEQFPHDKLDLRGRVIPVLAQEGGVGRGHQPISGAVNLVSPGSAGSEASTYYAVPHLVTSRNRSFFLENTEYATFDLSEPSEVHVRLASGAMQGRILHGNGPLELIERYTEFAGRMPVPPAWTGEGAIVAIAMQVPASRGIVEGLLDGGVRIAGVWNQTWPGKVVTGIGEQVLWNWSRNPAYHPEWSTFVQELAQKGIRTLCYVNPMFADAADAGASRNLFAEATQQGHLVKAADGGPLLLQVTAFRVGLLDLTHEAARAWMKAVIKDEMMTGAGCSGWMADFAEALPFDAVLASGVSAAAFHNSYPVEWARLNREAVEEAGRLGDVLVFNRSGHARTPGWAIMNWEGDQLTTWDKYDGLVSALHGLLNGGFSGISLNHSDTGGYTSLSLYGLVGYERESEQLKRWTEMNAFTALLRTHEGNQPGVNAQAYSNPDSVAHFARFSRVYRALAPYRTTVFQQAATRGWPVVRHLSMHFPDDAEARVVDDEFLLGSEVLVAPIKNKCFTWPLCPYDKSVYLPRGEWVHLWTGNVHGSAASGQWINVPAPIGEPAVFYRRGSTMAPEFVARLAAEGITVPAPP